MSALDTPTCVEAGRKDLWAKESQPTLDLVHDHRIRPTFLCRFDSTTQALAIWYNRCTMHFVINDYAGYRRHMNRAIIVGDWLR